MKYPVRCRLAISRGNRRIAYSKKKLTSFLALLCPWIRVPQLHARYTFSRYSPLHLIGSVVRPPIAVFKILASSSYIQVIDYTPFRLLWHFTSFSLASAYGYRCIRFKYLSFMRNGLNSIQAVYCVQSQTDRREARSDSCVFQLYWSQNSQNVRCQTFRVAAKVVLTCETDGFQTCL